MAADVIIRSATVADAVEMAPVMRQSEVDEILASGGKEPLPTLLEALNSSTESWVAFFDGRIACMWGVAPRSGVMSGEGIAWLLTTPVIESYKQEFWAYCTASLLDLLSRWDTLVNAIDCRHGKAIRWAKKLGFVLEEPAPFGVAGLPFQAFKVRKEDVHV
jgi:hypothetical protein